MSAFANGAWRSPGLWIGALAALYAGAMANWIVEVVRLTSARGNAAVLLASQALPVVALAVGVRRLSGRRRRAAVAGLLPLAAASVVVSALMGLAWAIGLVGDDAAFERIAVTRAPEGSVATYRTNGGATTAYGVVLRQEAELLPGVLLVRRLDHFYPASSASVTVVADDAVQVELDERDGVLGDPVRRTYHLRRLVYL